MFFSFFLVLCGISFFLLGSLRYLKWEIKRGIFVVGCGGERVREYRKERRDLRNLRRKARGRHH
jgi:hypothetical protein